MYGCLVLLWCLIVHPHAVHLFSGCFILIDLNAFYKCFTSFWIITLTPTSVNRCYRLLVLIVALTAFDSYHSYYFFRYSKRFPTQDLSEDIKTLLNQ